jgi:hypothetical protein
MLFGPGCGESTESRVPVYPARGQVYHKGKPVADALVVLKPSDSAKAPAGIPQPTGRTDRDGKFELHTYMSNDGAPAGNYVVGITISPAYDEHRDLMKNALSAAPKATQPRIEIDLRYTNPMQSGLKAEIKPGTNEIPRFNVD